VKPEARKWVPGSAAGSREDAKDAKGITLSMSGGVRWA
jgi:hypothetical protein